MVEVAVARAAEQHRAIQAEFRHSPLQFARRLPRGRRRERGEALEALGVRTNRRRDQVVRHALEIDRLFGREVVEPRRGQRQHLHVNPDRVHRRQAILSKVKQPRRSHAVRGSADRRVGSAGIALKPCVDNHAGGEVLFQADNPHRRWPVTAGRRAGR